MVSRVSAKLWRCVVELDELEDFESQLAASIEARERPIAPVPVPPPPVFTEGTVHTEESRFLQRTAGEERYLWDRVYAGGFDAVLAARKLLERADKKRVKYVIRSLDARWWLTEAGMQEYAPPPRAILYESQVKAEQALSDYRKSSEGAWMLKVEEMRE